MSVALTVNNKTFIYPTPGDEPGWGEGATDWAEEVTTGLNGFVGSGDFTEQTFTITAGATDVSLASIVFNTAEITGVSLSYKVSRGVTPSIIAEKGALEMIYNPDKAINERWSVSQDSTGDITGIIFNVTDAGQLRYSDVLSGGANGALQIESVSTLT